MKNITTLFLLFILLLSLAPCSDTLESDGSQEAISFQVAHNDDFPLESCTSICICTCCGQRTTVFEEISFKIGNPIFSSTDTIKPQSLIVEQRSRNIWQPPKIA